jgi:signal transduction histidine kinase
MVELNAETVFSKYLPLLRHPESEMILGRAYNTALILRCTGNINAAVERVSKIIFALKSFSGDGNGNAREMTVASLECGIEAVLTLYGNQIRQSTTLIRQYEDLPSLYCRHNELSQVWTHLIQNALQAMQHNGVLTIGVRRVNDAAVVSVGDTGCGIPEEIRGRIFDPFFTTRAIGEGSGLGLDIARKIVEGHKGRIEVDTEVGAGTTFSVFLPLNNLA